jgi:N-terminal acetyltransferase B complex catalytic subunit
MTALTITPSARRLGLATKLCSAMEQQCDANNAWFVDLYVRADNTVAQALYRKMGYSVFRRVVGYYDDNSDAFDMRKPLSRDKERLHVREGGEEMRISPSEVRWGHDRFGKNGAADVHIRKGRFRNGLGLTWKWNTK